MCKKEGRKRDSERCGVRKGGRGRRRRRDIVKDVCVCEGESVGGHACVCVCVQ